MPKVFGDTVCQRSLEVCPDEFIGVKFRGISRKVDGLDSRASSKEFLDELGPMDRASIPEKDDGSSKAPHQMLEELFNLFSPDVPGVKACVESKAASFGRDRNSRDSG